MKNSVLIVCFLIGSLQFLSSTGMDSSATPNKSIISKIIKSTEPDSLYLNLSILEKKNNAIPNDTCAKKAVLFNSNFQKKYITDEEFDYYREKTDLSFFAKLMNFLKKLFNNFIGRAPTKDISDWNWIIIRILCGIALLVILYYTIRYAMSHKGSWLFEKKNNSLEIDINNTEQLIEFADFEQLITTIENQGDSRQSIRLYYLWLLKHLKDNNLIVWLPEKTNADYLYEIQDDKLKKQFSYLSYIYNNIWYGEFSITDADYIEAKKAYINFIKN